MKRRRAFSVVLLCCSLLPLAACIQEVPPVVTVEVTAAPSLPTDTPLPPEPSPEPTATWTPEPSATTPPTPTSQPTATVSPTATEAAGLTLVIEQPDSGAEVVAGGEINVSGWAQPAPAEALLLAIEVVARSVASGSAQVDPDTGYWQATLPVSQHVTGPARLIVSPENSDEAAVIELEILPDEIAENPGLTLKRPGEHDTAVAGYTLFFEGRARNPIDNMVTISVMLDDCMTVATSQSFTLTGGAWHGLLILPPNARGPACAVATTGIVGEGQWREARLPINILTSDKESATSLTLGSPSDNRTFRAGQTAEIFGVAVNAPDDIVHVLISMDNQEGDVLAEGEAEVDDFGYWQLNLPLPENVTGTAIITASMGEGSNHIEFRTITTITE